MYRNSIYIGLFVSRDVLRDPLIEFPYNSVNSCIIYCKIYEVSCINFFSSHLDQICYIVYISYYITLYNIMTSQRRLFSDDTRNNDNILSFRSHRLETSNRYIVKLMISSIIKYIRICDICDIRITCDVSDCCCIRCNNEQNVYISLLADL